MASAKTSIRRVLARRWVRVLVAFVGLLLLFLLVVPVVSFEDPLSTVIFDRDGALLGATIAADGQWRFAPAESVPERYCIAATLFEDRRFHLHPGVDPLALVRATWQNLRAGRVVSGGSTLTMQVVRLSRKGRPRSYGEKLIEAVLAVRLELARSKQEILALYATYAPYGGNVVGLEAASWRYFGRAPDNLSWAETAMLAVLPNSPALIHPGRNRGLLLAKRNRLLEELQHEGHLDELSCSLAKQEQLPQQPLPLPMLAPHLLTRVQQEQLQAARDGRPPRARLHTTLQRHLQVRAADVLRRHHEQLAGNGIFNAAALIMEVDSGQVVAYLGNLYDLSDSEHGYQVDVITAPRSTGSILKPFLFAAMLESAEILPGELVADIPTRIGGFTPANFDRSYSGAVPAATALARSLNVPAARMLRSYGVDRFYRLLERLGLTTLHRPAEQYGLTLILGGAEGTLSDITAMYAGLARTVNQHHSDHHLGALFRPPAYSWETPAPGLPEQSQATPGPLGAGACYTTLQAMLEVSRPGVDSAWRSFASSRKIAWKTGTSYGYRDAWAVGVTPRYAVGVWVGNADGEGRAGLTGHSAAAPLLFELLGLLDTGGWFAAPESELIDIEVCATSGKRCGPSCGRRTRVRVPRSALPGAVCRYCRMIHLDGSERWRVHDGCEPVAAMQARPWFVLPPVMEWYYQQTHSDYLPLPPLRSDCREALGVPDEHSLSCISPKEGSTISVPVELDGSRGRTVFEAAHRRPETRIFWHIDDRYLGETSQLHQLAVAPEPGEHVLTLVDEHGEILRRRFTVVGQR